MAGTAVLTTPTLSVVIPAYGAWRTLPAVLEALEPQAADLGAHVVLVDSSGGDGAAALARDHPWLDVVASPERLLPGRARNVGAARSDTELLVFLDADAVPEPGWLRALVDRVSDDVDAVAGAVVNGTPHSRIGTAMHLLEFSEWLPTRAGRPEHAASCNLLVRRTAFEAAGGFHDDIWPGEDTILTYPLGAAGRLAFAPRATVVHANRTSVGELLRHQRRLGIAFRHVCRAVPFPHRAFAHRALSPLGVPFRLAALVRRIHGDAAVRRRALALVPELVLGLLAWSWGVATAPGG